MAEFIPKKELEETDFSFSPCLNGEKTAFPVLPEKTLDFLSAFSARSQFSL
jgi:hypothetical protein